MRNFGRDMSIFWRRLLVGGGLLGAICAGGPAAAADAVQPADTIVAAAVAASEERALQQGYDNVAVEVRPLDDRLRLPLCDEPLESFSPQAGQVLGAASVGVRCRGPEPWTIYVRTSVSARQEIPVLARSLPRNAVVTREDLKMIDQPLESAANGVILDPDRIVGMELTRALNAGSTIRLNQLRSPKIIKRGQQVTLTSGLNGLEVRIQGKALGDAAEGERVAVSNLSSGREVEGTAHSDGTVSVP